MRGAPGSGKTYLARSIVSRTVASDFANHIFSADDYFLMINQGVYVFDSSQLQNAHNFNFKRVQQALQQGRSPIIVDNTNTRAWEMHHFASIAVMSVLVFYFFFRSCL
jgi:uridine kinase